MGPVKYPKVRPVILYDLADVKDAFIRKKLGAIACAGMRLWPLVCRRGPFELSVGGIYEIVALWFAGDAIALVETGIEPLGGIGYAGLV